MQNQSNPAQTVLNPPSVFTSVYNSLRSLTCSHPNLLLKTYELRHSKNPKFIGTSKEYQELRLRPSEQYYQCSECFKKIPSTYMRTK